MQNVMKIKSNVKKKVYFKRKSRLEDNTSVIEQKICSEWKRTKKKRRPPLHLEIDVKTESVYFLEN